MYLRREQEWPGCEDDIIDDLEGMMAEIEQELLDEGWNTIGWVIPTYLLLERALIALYECGDVPVEEILATQDDSQYVYCPVCSR